MKLGARIIAALEAAPGGLCLEVLAQRLGDATPPGRERVRQRFAQLAEQGRVVIVRDPRHGTKLAGAVMELVSR